MDFMVLDMEVDKKIPLILGGPFLSTANAHIEWEQEKFNSTLMGPRTKFNFKPKVKQCSIIKVRVMPPCVIYANKQVKPQPRVKPKRVWRKKVMQPSTFPSPRQINAPV